MQKLTIGDAELGVLARMLRKVEFFSPLTIGQIEQILPYIMLYRFEAGEIICKQGDPAEAFYILYKGKIDITMKKGFLSFAKKVAELGEGDFFGEIALITNEPRGATVTCTEPTQAFVLLAGDFQFILKQNPAAAEDMKRLAARRSFSSRHDGGTAR